MDKRTPDDRLREVTQMLVELGKGNFDARLQIDNDDDIYSVIYSGLNMLAEEFSFYKTQLDTKTALLYDTLYNINEVIYAVSLSAPTFAAVRFDFVSPRIRNILGYTEEQIYEDPTLCYAAVHPADLLLLEEALAVLYSGREVTCQYRVMHHQRREYIWLEDRMIPKRSSDSPVMQAFCSARNITRLKRESEERDRLTKELSDKYNEMMQFNYIVSHNLRGPVASILGMGDLAAHTTSDAERTEMLGYIMQSAAALDGILSDLNVILAAKSKVLGKQETFSIAETIKTTELLLHEQIENVKAALIIDIAPGADSITSIRSYIQSCFFNLVSNALKFRHSGRPLRITIRVWVENGLTHIQVADNGTGMDMEKYRSKLFGLYQRFDLETEGKGLGLYMTKLQIESLGGHITVDSKIGEGTIFTITLP